MISAFVRSSRIGKLTALPMLIGAALCGSAQAVEGPVDASFALDRRGEATERAQRSTAWQAPIAATTAWRATAERLPGWVARWDAVTGRPERFDGPPIAITGFAARGDAPDQIALAFVEQALRDWVDPAELSFVRAVRGGRGEWVHFRQMRDGVPVYDSRFTVRLEDTGTVSSVTLAAIAPLSSGEGSSRTAIVSSAPLIDAAMALTSALEGLPSGARARGEAELCFLPIRTAGALTHRLSWRLVVETDEPIGVWATLVDASSGELLWRFNEIRHANVTGSVTADIEMVTADDNYQLRGLPHLRVSISGPDSIHADTTDTVGDFEVSIPTTTTRTLRAGLRGPFGQVIDATSGAGPSLELSVDDGEAVTRDVHFGLGDADASERDAYYHTMLAHDFMQRLDPEFTALDYVMPITVDISSQCNAFWNGVGINFYEAGGPCINTARIADVVYHEYGHGVTDYAYRPFPQPSGAMHEGFSDYLAATMTRQPLIGIGFFGPGSHLRRVDEDRVFPDDVVDESHTDGLIIASALWDFREDIGAGAADSLWHFARYGYSADFDDYLIDLLRVDDDNGDIYDGTPNFERIVRNFRPHGVGDYSIQVGHADQRDTEDTASPIELQATFLGLFQIVNESVTAHVTLELDGDEQSLQLGMFPTGVSRQYAVSLAAQPAETVVRYRLVARDASGQETAYPADGGEISFRVGTDVTAPSIQLPTLPSRPEGAASVEVFADVTDNLDRDLTSVNLIYRRNGGAEVTLAMQAVDGGGHRAEVPLAGDVVGDLFEYRVEATDGASTPNSAREPQEGFRSFEIVRGTLATFEGDHGGYVANPLGEWAWGEPVLPATAASGVRAWGCVLDGFYSHGSFSTLETPPHDLTGYEHATLAFDHWFITEPLYDGGYVEVSTDGGANWVQLQPEGGYNSIVGATGSQGWTGNSQGVQSAEFELSRYRGAADCRFRFTFASDIGIVGPGWIIDDVEVLERQVLAQPTGLDVQSLAQQVDVSWQLPRGIAEGPESPVVGYHVYRSPRGVGEPALLTGTPVIARSYSDTEAAIGQWYEYWVSAVYDDGESPLVGPLEGAISQPVLSLDVEAVSARVDSAGVHHATIAVSNSGSGRLELNLFPSVSGQSIDDARIRLELQQPLTDAARAPTTMASARGVASTAGLAEALRGWSERRGEKGAMMAAVPTSARLAPPGAEWDTLLVDGDDSDSLDFATVEAQEDGENIYLRVTTFEGLPNPTRDMNLVFRIDTDENLDTGGQFGEWAILAGAQVQAQIGAPAVVVSEGFQVIIPPSHFVFAEGGRSAEFGVPKAVLGNVNRLFVSVEAASGDGQLDYDEAPNAAPSWVLLSASHFEVEAGDPTQFELVLDAAELGLGTHEAVLFVETNEATSRVVEVPITLEVGEPTPVFLADFGASLALNGVEIVWMTVTETDLVGFHVLRREEGAVDELRVTEEMIAPEHSRLYRFVDVTAEPGRMYEYRLGAIAGDGSATYHGPLRISTDGLGVPTSVWLAPPTPNPARAESLVRFALPRSGPARLSIYAADGRRVRRIVDATRLAAGPHSYVWDGRDDAGHSTPAGIYLMRLDADGVTRTVKATRTR